MRSPVNDCSVPIPPLASQFVYAPQESMPERRLMAAVLADALNILQRGQAYHEDREAADTYRDALAWIMAERDAWPFCFAALCEALGLNADKVRARLLERNGMASGATGRGRALCRTVRS